MDWFPRVFEVPIISFIGARPVDDQDPTAGLSFVVTDKALNAAGALHGGVLGTVLDLAAYLSVIPTLGRGEQAVTHAISASYLSGSEVGETLVARGELLRRTRRLAFSSASVTSGERLIATASVTKSILGPDR
jgi:uncharacterized protein (TIGR00369 family)